MNDAIVELSGIKSITEVVPLEISPPDELSGEFDYDGISDSDEYENEKVNDHRLTASFEQFKTLGYHCFEGGICCSNCGYMSVPKKSRKKYVFYCDQIADIFIDSGIGYLQWNGNAKLILKILRSNGLKCSWDGLDKDAICVDLENRLK